MKPDSKAQIAKWYNNADSPVVLMVDDFTNVWIDVNGNGLVDLGEDWGHALDGPNSSFKFLTSQILGDYPAVKVTFFTPVARVPTIVDYKCKAHFGPINETEKVAAFFKSVHENERFEIAYHGLTHGVSGKNTREFVQEWLAFKTLAEALETIDRGKKIYFEVFGELPSGGKYSGYKYNSFSDESIDKSGFLWWCRKWDREESCLPDTERFDARYFGESKVIDIPSTVHGALFNQPKRLSHRLLKRRVSHKEGIAELDGLLQKKLVISIQEHISPARTDGRRQTPNIFDDAKSLRTIFDYLRDKNVWYCTGTELAEYVYCRDNVVIEEHEKGFSLRSALEKNVQKRLISLLISDERIDQVVTPDGKTVTGSNGVFNVPVGDGTYSLVY
jgi:hypothetical protein